MTDVGEFIDEFLEHRSEYDPRKAREYYLRTRKLKGPSSRGSRSNTENFKKTGAVPARASKARVSKAYRIERADDKLSAARAKASKLPPKKRKEFEIKFTALERKLNKARRKVKKTKRQVNRGVENVRQAKRNVDRNVESFKNIPKNTQRPKNPFQGAKVGRAKPRKKAPRFSNPFDGARISRS